MKKVTFFVLPVCLVLWFSHCKKSGSGKPKKAMVTTIAGMGEPGYLDATAAFAKFSYPSDVAVHADGTIYITDYNNRRVRKLTPEGIVFTFAGNGIKASTNGSATMASFAELHAITMDAQGNLYVFDAGSPQVRKISPGGEVFSFAGAGVFGFSDGRADTARFRSAWDLAMDDEGSLYVSDTYNLRIRKIANGHITTVAGTSPKGYLDGNALQARFNNPRGMAIDKQGNFYVCDTENFRIRKMTPAGVVSTLAGNGSPGYSDGGPGTAQFSFLEDVVIDKTGNLYVADEHRIRKISPEGEVTTIAGSQMPGFADGEGGTALFKNPSGLDIDAAGNIYIADSRNQRIRKISFQ